MASDIDLSALPPPAQKALSPEAPAPLRTMAARGVLPGLKPHDLVIVVGALAQHADPAVAEVARGTLAKLPGPVLAGALSHDLPGSVIERLVEAQPNNYELVTGVLKMPRVTEAALVQLALQADERAGELIANNEQLMLAHPPVIEKLYMNKAVRMSTADRLIELAVRNDIELAIPAFREAAVAIKNELVPEPSPEPTFDDVEFVKTDELAEKAEVADEEDTHEIDEEGEEKVRSKFLPLYAQIAQLTVTQKIRRAMVGTAAERLLLVRDSNRLVASAAVKSPNMRENEAAQISASRAVSEEVLRTIAMNREFVRSYQVKLNLITNPRTPFTFAARLVPHLRQNDLRSLSRSKNISGAISQAIKQQLSRKQDAK